MFNNCVTIGDTKEVDTYWRYLSYRVQRALFEVCQEDPILTGISWNDFKDIMRHRKQVREAALRVLCQTIERYSLDSSPPSSEIEFFRPSDIEDADDEVVVHAIKIASSKKGHALVELLFLRVEIFFYREQIQSGKEYSWESFVQELLLGQRLWNTLRHKFHRILIRLDFKGAWQTMGTDIVLEALNEDSGEGFED